MGDPGLGSPEWGGGAGPGERGAVTRFGQVGRGESRVRTRAGGKDWLQV